MLDNSYFLFVLKSECSSTWDCRWLLTVFPWNLKMVCKSPYKCKSVDLKFLSARHWALLWEMFMYSLWLHVQGWRKQKVKIIVSHCHLFSIDYGMSDPLLTHLWTWSTAFVLMQLKTGFATPIFRLYFNLFSKSGMISTIYHKYSKSFIENIPFPAPYTIGIYWNNFLI